MGALRESHEAEPAPEAFVRGVAQRAVHRFVVGKGVSGVLDRQEAGWRCFNIDGERAPKEVFPNRAERGFILAVIFLAIGV